jgi:hypothetical protein
MPCEDGRLRKLLSFDMLSTPHIIDAVHLTCQILDPRRGGVIHSSSERKVHFSHRSPSSSDPPSIPSSLSNSCQPFQRLETLFRRRFHFNASFRSLSIFDSITVTVIFLNYPFYQYFIVVF